MVWLTYFASWHTSKESIIWRNEILFEYPTIKNHMSDEYECREHKQTTTVFPKTPCLNPIRTKPNASGLECHPYPILRDVVNHDDSRHSHV